MHELYLSIVAIATCSTTTIDGDATEADVLSSKYGGGRSTTLERTEGEHVG